MNANLKYYLTYTTIAVLFEHIGEDEKSEEIREFATEFWHKLSESEIEQLRNHDPFKSDMDIVNWNLEFLNKKL